jgi:hypothetical protein
MEFRAERWDSLDGRGMGLDFEFPSATKELQSGAASDRFAQSQEGKVYRFFQSASSLIAFGGVSTSRRFLRDCSHVAFLFVLPGVRHGGVSFGRKERDSR